MRDRRRQFEMLPVRAIVFFVLAIASIAGLWAGDPIAAPTSTLPLNACLIESYEWHDADTPVRCLVRQYWGVRLYEVKGCRDEEYDAWEVGARGGANVTESEKEKGRKALADLRVLSVNRSLYIAPKGAGQRDDFGRLLGKLYLVGGDGKAIRLRDWAEANGHVRGKAVK